MIIILIFFLNDISMIIFHLNSFINLYVLYRLNFTHLLLKFQLNTPNHHKFKILSNDSLIQLKE